MPGALGRTTHLGVGAHADDVELIAPGAIGECHGREDRWFTGVVCTDGARSPRGGSFAGLPDREVRDLRRAEQREAAELGGYAAVIQLDHPSSALREQAEGSCVDDLVAVLEASTPTTVLTHDPADRHPTHAAVARAAIAAVRRLPPGRRPERLLGCEGWRSLDWLPLRARVLLPVDPHGALAERLLATFRSQVAGGKRYDRAALGRWRANATFADPRALDRWELATQAVDLTPLVHDERPVDDYLADLLEEFRAEVMRVEHDAAE